MLLLDTTTDKISLVTDAAGDIEVDASWMDHSAGTFTPGGDRKASITTATTIDIVAAPAASTQRNVKHLNIRNNHASQAVLCTVQSTDGTNTVGLMVVTLLAGESLVFTQGGLWVHYDANGGMYPQVGAQASQAEMEAGTSLVTTVSPGRFHFHPGSTKCWGKTTVSGGVPTLQVSYNVTSITDTATCRLTWTIATDFSSANYAITLGMEPATTTYSATTTSLIHVIRNASIAAGTFVVDNLEIDIGQATDPASWHFQACGDLA